MKNESVGLQARIVPQPIGKLVDWCRIANEPIERFACGALDITFEERFGKPLFAEKRPTHK
jgi:hypothetical protein